MLQATAGHSLGGWLHPQHRVSPTNFDPVIENLRVDRAVVTNFIHTLLQIDDYNLGLHGCLWRFTVTCAATLTMYYPTFKSEVGANHFVVWHIDNVLQKFDISSVGVREWSEQIRTNWERENAHCLVGGNESVVVEEIQLQFNILLVELSKLKKQGRAIENWLEELSQQQQNTIDMLFDCFTQQKN